MCIREAVNSCAGELINTEDGFSCAYTLTEDSVIFHGHFPESPVLPAVVQCIMIQRLIEDKPGSLFDIEDAKFTAPVSPPCTVLVRAQKGKKEGQFVGVVSVDDIVHAKITLKPSTL